VFKVMLCDGLREALDVQDIPAITEANFVDVAWRLASRYHPHVVRAHFDRMLPLFGEVADRAVRSFGSQPPDLLTTLLEQRTKGHK
jgi:hypothetical protein